MKESPKILFSVSQEFIPQAIPEATVPFFIIFNNRGPIEEQLVDLAGYEVLFGKPDVLNYGVTALYPYLFLERTKGVCYVRRALHVEDVSFENVAKYSGALSRWIKDGVDDQAMAPIVEGIAVNGFENYNFPSSQDTRKIFKLSESSIFKPTTTATILVSNADNLLKDADKISILASNEVPDSETVLRNIVSQTEVLDTYNYVKFTTTIGSIATAGFKVREVVADYYDGYIFKDGAYIVPQIISGSVIAINDGTLFSVGEIIRFNSLNIEATQVEYTVTAISNNTITIDSADLDTTVVTENQTIYSDTSSTTTGNIKVVLTDGYERVIPRLSVTASTTIDLPSSVEIVTGDLLFVNAATTIANTSNAVTNVVNSSTAGYKTITLTSAVTLSGENDLENAFDIFVQRPGFNGLILRELISPQTGLNVVVRETAPANTADVLIDDNDVVNAGMRILIDNGSTPVGAYSGSYITVSNKYNIDNSFTQVELDEAVTTTLTSKIYVKVNSDLKEKDAILWVSLTPGAYANKLAIDIADNTQEARFFNVSVFFDGTQVEGPFVCSRNKEDKDAYGNSLFVEDVINGRSTYVWAVDNPDAVSPVDNSPYRPLNTDYMILKPDPVAQYEVMRCTLAEKVLSGDSVIKILGETSLDVIEWSVGNTLSILKTDGSYASYRIYSVSIDELIPSLANITIVGTVQENHLSGAVVNRLTGFVQGANILISGNDTTVDIGSPFTFGTSTYTVVDAGANWFKKGADGLLNQQPDFIAALDNFTNLNKFPEELLLSDGGLASIVTFSGMSQIAKTRERCHFYGSVPKLSPTLTQGQYVEQAGVYADSTLSTDKYSSIFAGYSKVSYGANSFWVNDHLFTIINQYMNTLTGEGVLPAANNRGSIYGIIDKDIILDIPFQDRLESKQINYSRKVGSGHRNMSNTTRYPVDSFFQSRHIIHYVNAVHSIVEDVFQPYLQTVVTESDVDNVDTSIGNLLTRNLEKMTESYETVSTFLPNGNGTTTWRYKLYVKPRDITTKILFDLTVTHKTLEIKVVQG